MKGEDIQSFGAVEEKARSPRVLKQVLQGGSDLENIDWDYEGKADL